MIETYINNIFLNTCLNPVYDERNNCLKFSDIHIGEKKTYVGKIMRVIDINKLVLEEDVIAIFYEGELAFNDIISLKKRGVLFLVCNQKFLCATFSSMRIPILLWDEQGKIRSFFENEKMLDISITLDLSMFKSARVNQCTVVYDNSLDIIGIQNRIETSIVQIKNLLPDIETIKFQIYYFASMQQLYTFTGMKTTAAYKDKMIFLTYSKKNNSTEIHEMLHILLYQMGDPPFLLKEGFPTLGYELCNKKRKFNRFICNIYMRNRLEKNLPCSTIEKLMDYVSSDRVYSGEDYYTAASFLSWVIFKKGIGVIWECYQKMNRLKSMQENRQIFEKTVGETLDNVIAEWKHKILTE